MDEIIGITKFGGLTTIVLEEQAKHVDVSVYIKNISE